MDRENIHKMPCVAYVQSVYEIEDDFNQHQQQLNMLPPVYLQHVYIKLFLALFLRCLFLIKWYWCLSVFTTPLLNLFQLLRFLKLYTM